MMCPAAYKENNLSGKIAQFTIHLVDKERQRWGHRQGQREQRQTGRDMDRDSNRQHAQSGDIARQENTDSAILAS